MNLLDWAIIAYLVLGLWHGWARGFVAVLASLVGFVAAYFLADHYYLAVATAADRSFLRPVLAHAPGGAGSFMTPTVIDAIAFFAIVLAVEIIVGLVVPIFTLANRVPIAGSLNRLVGALFGLAEHAVIAGIILFILSPLLGGLTSPFGHYLSQSNLYAHYLTRWAPPFTK